MSVPTVQSYDAASHVGYERVCEGSRAELSCPAGRTLRVVSSTYGRLVSYEDDPVCSYNGNGALDTTDCETNTTGAVQTLCNSRESCEVRILTASGGDREGTGSRVVLHCG